MKKYKHVFAFLFYFLITSVVGFYFSKKSKSDSIISSLRNIDYKSILVTFIFIFSVSFFISLAIVGYFLRLSHDKDVDRIRTVEFKAIISVVSVVALIFSLIINLTINEFELILNVLTFALLFTFSVNYFLNYVKNQN